ncbi:MAG: hypothetical protein NWP31_04705 [Solirubrobacteraceae bacterium]|nr:hypothetical protein [Solirubrobacteraceae bacterium]MDP4672166.1 hypothetical protein [Solirubrobacteraceae bacterium]MDP4921470.1 hypothetical protein [Solirubrobacteraceae bacterium]MDP5034227.1 hypothetical protein [Solirubrobacteraceae bacterium]
MSTAAPRLRSAWETLYREQRLATAAAIGLLLSMLLPWYQQGGFVTRPGQAPTELSDSFNAFQSWGFVEASVLLVALGVIALCAARADRRAFHLPGGDGIVLMAAGAWVMFLIFYRQLDRPSGNDSGVLRPIGSPSWGEVGVDWGIFVAFLLGAVIVYAGWQMRAHDRPEPLLDGDDPHSAVVEGDPNSVVSTMPIGTPRAMPETPAASAPGRPRTKPGPAAAPLEGQLSFEDSSDEEPES